MSGIIYSELVPYYCSFVLLLQDQSYKHSSIISEYFPESISLEFPMKTLRNDPVFIGGNWGTIEHSNWGTIEHSNLYIVPA